MLTTLLNLSYLCSPQSHTLRLGIQRRRKPIRRSFTLVTANYRQAIAEIAALQLSENELRRVILPLPPTLYQRDFILASLTRQDAVVYRLRQMKKLPQYAAEQAFLESLAQLFEQLGPVEIEDRVRTVSYFASPTEFFDQLNTKK